MKLLLPLVALLVIPQFVRAQCDTLSIDKTGWTIPYVDSEELTGEGPDNGHASDCIDNDSLTFWHTEWQAADPGFPHEIQLDLGTTHAVNGVSLLSRSGTAAGKTKGYELYLSMDGIDWGTMQSAGELTYADVNAGSQRGTIHFGAVDARYVRMVMTSNYQGDPYIMVAEFDVLEFVGTGCEATGQANQIVSIDPIVDQSSTAAPIILNGSTSSGLPLTFSVVSGPATVVGSTLTLTGAAGAVIVGADQAGDAFWYAASATTSFEVLDLSTYEPVVTTTLTEAFPVEMAELHAYALYAQASIDEPDFNTITGVTFNVDGTELPALLVNGAYQAWWTPSSYGMHAVTVTATASNGNSTSETLNIDVTNTITDRTVSTFDGAVIDFGSIGSQWYQGSYTLPQFVGAYDHIEAHLSVSCPAVAGGCDDWDRLAWVEVKAPNGQWVELIRYVTPYGRACDHSIDVTDLASVLQGNVEIRMYIETWGTGGWKLDLDLTYEAGTPDFLYSAVQQVWRGNYNFGDPANLQPVDTMMIDPGQNAEAATLRLVTTGHGWGANNTGNAAEFYHATHHVFVNGQSYTQDLWQTCNPNPDGCSPQAGTWTYDRAGWCPGSIAPPFNYDLTDQLGQGSMEMAYIFQTSYVDLCHPNNPDCVSGSTCANCNDGYNPYYPVSCYLITKGNYPVILGITTPVAKSDITLRIGPNPSDGIFAINLEGDMGKCVVTVHDIAGVTLKTWFFASRDQLNDFHFNLTGMASGTYFVKVQNEATAVVGKVVVK